MKKCIILVTLIGLLFTFTNFIPISAIPALLIIFIPFLVCAKSKYNLLFVSLLFLQIYLFVSTLFYAPESLLEYDFYRRDGNVFITFSPLLVLLLLKGKINIEKIFDAFLYSSTLINFLCLVTYFLSSGTINGRNGIYLFLFIGHNAAGGFLMVLTAISIARLLTRCTLTSQIIFVINFVALIATNSRGSILAIFCSVIMLMAYKVNYEKFLIFMFAFLQIFLYGWLYVNAPSDFLYASYNTYDPNIFENNFNLNRLSTFIIRGFYLWPRAIYLFLESPIVGTGFGSYNDVPYNFVGVDGFFVYNDAKMIFDDHHAHNTFLHVLAETGILGMVLLITFMFYCEKYIKTIKNKYIFLGLYLSLWGAIFSSVTEHRFFTPSQMLPFVLLLGLTHLGGNQVDVEEE